MKEYELVDLTVVFVVDVALDEVVSVVVVVVFVVVVVISGVVGHSSVFQIPAPIPMPTPTAHPVRILSKFWFLQKKVLKSLPYSYPANRP